MISILAKVLMKPLFWYLKCDIVIGLTKLLIILVWPMIVNRDEIGIEPVGAGFFGLKLKFSEKRTIYTSSVPIQSQEGKIGIGTT